MKTCLSSLFLLILLTVALPASLKSEVLINEVMASNGLTLADEDGDFEDWIELWNSGDTTVDLSGYGLSDDTERPMRWTFPEGVSIGPDDYLLVWASGKDRRDPNGELHTNFGISSEGEPILLSTPDGTLVDDIPKVVIPRDYSFGRGFPDVYNLYFFPDPTPGGANTSAGFVNFLPPPTLSVASGFFPQQVTVEITHDDPDAEIYYSLDGSRNPANMQRYEGPIILESRAGEPNGISMIKTSPPEMRFNTPFGWYEPIGEVMKANILTAVAVKENYLSPEPASATYFVGPEWMDRFTPNVISIVTDPDHLFDHDTGIYVPGRFYQDNGFGSDYWGRPFANYHQRGAEWERPISFEYFDPSDWSTLTHGNLQMRIHGGGSRALPQKSLRLYDRGSQFGGPGLDFPFFDERPYQGFSRLILRNSGQDWAQYSNTMLLDAFLQRLLRIMGIEYQAYEPSVLFLNGEYWGIHNIRERIDRFFIAQQYNIDPDQIDMLTGNAEVDEGSNEHYLDMMQFMRTSDMNAPGTLAQVNEMMDIRNYQDYVIAQTFIANWDWPGNNIDFWRLQTDYHPDKPKGLDGRWRWIIYDLDFAYTVYYTDYMNYPQRDMIAHLRYPTSGAWPNPEWSVELINLLWQSEDFTREFLIRYADHMNTTFRPERVWNLLPEMAAVIQDEIVPHYQRWGRGDYTLTTWNRYVGPDGHHWHYAVIRRGYVWQHLRDNFNLDEPVSIRLRNEHPEKGYLKINNMRLEEGYAGWVHGRPYEWTGEYFPGLPISVTAVADPGYAFAGWVEFPDHDSDSIEFLPEEVDTITAIFEPGPVHELMHFWHFNNTNSLSSLLEPSYTVGDPAIQIQPGPETEVEDGGSNGFSGENARMGAPAGRHLRINNPLGAQVDIALPSEGYHSLQFAYETRRSGQGAGIQQLTYTTNGEDFHPLHTLVVLSNDPILHTWDLRSIEGANNNPDFAIRIEFEQGEGGTAGNNRFDNMTLEGVPYTDFLNRDIIAANDAWRQSAAFGRFAEINTQWAYHHKAGWIYSADSRNSLRGAWIWSESLESWLWLSSRIGPNRAYSANQEAWLWWDAAGQQWQAIPQQ